MEDLSIIWHNAVEKVEKSMLLIACRFHEALRNGSLHKDCDWIAARKDKSSTICSILNPAIPSTFVKPCPELCANMA